MLVYKATHIDSGRSYIGITRQSLAERKRCHKSAAAGKRSNTAFHQAIRQYGWDRFTWEVLRTCETEQELQAAERELIAAHDTIRSGFNRTAGGNGTVGYVFTDDVRQRMSELASHRMALKHGIKKQTTLFPNRLGVPHSDATKQRISESLRKVDPSRWARKISPAQYPDIKAMRERGLSFRKIGEALGVRPETVFYFCKRNAEAA